MLFLFNNEGSKFIYIIKASLLSVFCSYFVGFLIYLSSSQVVDNNTFPETFEWFEFFNLIIFTPSLETIMISILVFWIRYFTNRRYIILFSIPFVFSYLHFSVDEIWGFYVFFPFLIFTISYIVWCETSHFDAFFVCSMIHGLANLFSFMIFILIS